jgi:hypothetical protein
VYLVKVLHFYIIQILAILKLAAERFGEELGADSGIEVLFYIVAYFRVEKSAFSVDVVDEKVIELPQGRYGPGERQADEIFFQRHLVLLELEIV